MPIITRQNINKLFFSAEPVSVLCTLQTKSYLISPSFFYFSKITIIIHPAWQGVDFFQFSQDNQLWSTSRYDFTSRKVKTGTCDRSYISAAGTPTAAAPALRFLRAEKRKLVYLLLFTVRLSPSQLLLAQYHFRDLLAHLQLLPLRYDFRDQKIENRYLRPAWHTCCPRITIFTIGKAKTGTCDQPDTPAAAAPAFAIEKAKTAKDVLDKKAPAAGTAAPRYDFYKRKSENTQVRVTSLTDLQLLPPRYDFYDRKSENRYLRPAWHTCSCSAFWFLQTEKRKQVPATGLTHLQLLPSRYDFSRFIFRVRRQVHATGQASGTRSPHIFVA